MASKSESSFGAKAAGALKIGDYITNYNGYNPPRAEEKPADFKTFVGTAIVANEEATRTVKNYNFIINKRASMFRTDQISVVKLVAPIRGAVSALFGKNSVEMQQIDVLADKIRGNKLIRIAATDTVDEHTISQSEKSYGSSTQYFKDLVTTLQTFPTYDPSRVELKVANLLTFIGQLDALNSQANTSFQLMKAAKATRRDIYTELNDRTQRIKSYVKSQYGTSSQEFILIKGIKI